MHDRDPAPVTVVATTLDPEGRRVVLTEERWTHIKRRHPDMAPHLRLIMQTVRDPDRRARGHSEAETWFFTHVGGYLPWLRVAVHYGEGGGWIATAFRQATPPPW
jgi:hypothetical protein